MAICMGMRAGWWLREIMAGLLLIRGGFAFSTAGSREGGHVWQRTWFLRGSSSPALASDATQEQPPFLETGPPEGAFLSLCRHGFGCPGWPGQPVGTGQPCPVLTRHLPFPYWESHLR